MFLAALGLATACDSDEGRSQDAAIDATDGDDDGTVDIDIEPADEGADADSGSNPNPGGDAAGDSSLNRLVLTTKDEEIVAFDPSGAGHASLFRFADGDDVTSLQVHDGVIYAGAGDNSVNAIDLQTGALLWDVPLGRYEHTSLAHPRVEVYDGSAYASGVPGVLTAIDIADRRIQWEYPLDPDGDTDGYFPEVGALLVTQDTIFVGTTSNTDTNHLHAVDRATGRRRWRLSLAHEEGAVPQRMSGAMKRVGDLLLVPADNLYALDASTGDVRWAFAMETHSRGAGAPSISNGRVYVQGAAGVADGRLFCLDLATGAARWSLGAGNDYAGRYSPSVVGGVVFGVYERGVDGREGLPFMADAETGEVLWSNEDVEVATSPVFANGQLFFDGHDLAGSGSVDERNGFLALDAQTGALQWLDNYVRWTATLTPMVIADNGMFYASADQG